MKLLYVVNEARFFLSHRLPLAREALARGYDVAVVTAADTGEAALAAEGLRHIPVPLSRSGFAPLQELRSYKAISRVLSEERPDVTHHVTIKPVIYGSLAARRKGVPAVVNAVPGMGFVFARRGVRAAILRTLVNAMYRIAMAHPRMKVIFQNTEDMRGFIGHAIVRREDAVLIRGSGVDLDEFAPAPEPEGPPVFVLVARMLRDKGINEFARAAKRVRAVHPDWRFLLAGDVDEGNPTSFSANELKALESEYGVTWLGQCADVAKVMQESHVVCLPTFYREGVPKALLEASAVGRPMIATKIAGCREVVTDGVTGILVAPREVDGLGKAMLKLGEDPALRRRFGEAARARAEAVFSEADVVEHTFRVYEELTS